MIKNFKEIKQGVEDLRIHSIPSAEEGFWFYPDRDKKSVRYVQDDDSLYDIYLEKEIENYPDVPLKVSAKVRLYDLRGHFTVMENKIFRFSFIGRQPNTQIFLVNLFHYQNQIDETVEKYAGVAMSE
jgi:hypothetical protein